MFQKIDVNVNVTFPFRYMDKRVREQQRRKGGRSVYRESKERMVKLSGENSTHRATHTGTGEWRGVHALLWEPSRRMMGLLTVSCISLTLY